MNGTTNRYLLDTNIFIYYFNGETAVQSIVSEVLAGQSTGCYCPVSWAELLCYPALTEEEANQIRSFLRLFTSVSLNEQVLDRAAQIRCSRRIALPDALIAACAIESNSILMDSKHSRLSEHRRSQHSQSIRVSTDRSFHA